MILVFYEIEVLTEKRMEFIQAIPNLLDPVMQQNGCFRHILCQELKNKNKFIVHQVWDNQKSLDKHLQSESFSTFLGASHLLRSEPILEYHTISSTAGKETLIKTLKRGKQPH